MELIVELYYKENKSRKETITFNKLMKKLQNYIITRCMTIRKLYMEQVLLAGNFVTLDGFKYAGYINHSHQYDHFDHCEDVITVKDVEREENELAKMGFYHSYKGCNYEDIFDLEKRGIIFERGESHGISQEIVDQVLNKNKNIGNMELTKMLAEKGLIMDEVLAIGLYITPKGYENLEYLSIFVDASHIAENRIITVFDVERFYNDMRDFFRDFPMTSNYYDIMKLEQLGMVRMPDSNLQTVNKQGK